MIIHTLAGGVAGILALAGALAASQAVLPGPSIPPELTIPSGNEPFFKAAATGTQNFICMPSGWTFLGPQATLFVSIPWIGGSIRQQVATHYLVPNAHEGGTLRPVWQSSQDTSLVAAKAVAEAVVDTTAIPWLKLQAAGAQNGPAGGSWLSQTTFIQRVNTTGGLKPATACTVGAREFVPYTADYVFFRKSTR